MCEDKEGRWPGEVFISVSSYFKECPAFSSIAAMTLVIDLGDLDSPAVVDLTLLAPPLILLMSHHHRGMSCRHHDISFLNAPACSSREQEHSLKLSPYSYHPSWNLAGT